MLASIALAELVGDGDAALLAEGLADADGVTDAEDVALGEVDGFGGTFGDAGGELLCGGADGEGDAAPAGVAASASRPPHRASASAVRSNTASERMGGDRVLQRRGLRPARSESGISFARSLAHGTMK